ncbi:MAG TPA: alkaline phosphatase family protein, partial [Candidatus Limnocylindria bacterium]|nr:alkaline phosphatase family protein [Candidatus Limnocylindria bacterium]
MPRGIVRHVALLTAGLCVLSACGPSVLAPAGGTGIHKIKHVIVIMQENRTFDSYFGRYPGADGLPNANGVFTVCSPDPLTSQCVYPYHDTHDVNGGGPHGQADALADIDAGKMDGFVAQAERGRKGCSVTNNPACGGDKTDVMGYHTRDEIPNYWSYADNFVLQDRMFEP